MTYYYRDKLRNAIRKKFPTLNPSTTKKYYRGFNYKTTTMREAIWFKNSKVIYEHCSCFNCVMSDKTYPEKLGPSNPQCINPLHENCNEDICIKSLERLLRDHQYFYVITPADYSETGTETVLAYPFSYRSPYDH